MSLTFIHRPSFIRHLIWSAECWKILDDEMEVGTIFKEDNTWLVELSDTLSAAEFNQVHAKLQEIISNEHQNPNK